MTEEDSPLADTVKLISADGFEFIMNRKCAMASGTIKNMLSSPGTLFYSITFLTVIDSLLGQFTESVQNEITFRDVK